MYASRKKKSVYWIKLERNQPEMEMNSTYECGHSRELKWNTLFNEASAINRKKGKMHDCNAHAFLILIFASLLTIINTNEEKWFGVV